MRKTKIEELSPDYLSEALEQREKEIQSTVKKLEKRMATAPEGSLRIKEDRNGIQYYHRTNNKDTNGKYISKKDMPRIIRLAQKDYDKKALQELKKEMSWIHKMLKMYCPETLNSIFFSFHKNRQSLMEPVTLENKEYARRWLDEKYLPLDMDFPEETAFLTSTGQYVRSKSEALIVNSLHDAKVPFRYECPVFLGNNKRYPDFTCLNVRTRKTILWEHFGMLDNVEYLEKNIRKLEEYERNGYLLGKNLIITYETSTHPLNLKLVQNKIQEYLK